MSTNKLFKKIRSKGGWKARVLDLIDRQKPELDEDEPFIICDNLVKIYKIADLEVMALQGLELQIKKGELMAIIGSSGSGKTTLLNILGGLDEPTAGKVHLAGWDLSRMSYRDKLVYRRRVVGFVWQNIGRNLIPYLTARENVRLPMILGGQWRNFEWAEELLDAVGLADRKNHRPAEMSGGQQQRVGIAVALANRPDVLLADEPTGSLDTETGQDVLRVFRTVVERFGITVMVVTHDRSLSSAVDRVVEIRDGKISTESVRQKDDLREEMREGEIGKDKKEEDGQEEEAAASHQMFTVLDKAGRLQIPDEYLRELGIEQRAALEKKDGQIIIRAPEAEEQKENKEGETREDEEEKVEAGDEK